VIPKGVEHFDLQAGDVRLHCAAMGPGDGPLVLLLHGFPECWASWRYQLPALAAAGFRAVAPDLRGYGTSEKPRGVLEYTLPKLARDVDGLIAALGRDRADLVGHDWGGYVAWHAAMWHSARVRRVAVLNVPHPHRFLRALRSVSQLRKSWYMFFFQLPFLPERFMSTRSLRTLFRYMTARREAYDDEDIATILEAVRDLTPPLNYYRAAGRTLLLQRWKPIEAPALVIWGEADRWISPDLAEPDPKWVPHARVERIPGASHFVQADAPERVNELLLGFLR
jgi:pimeloyl-ACP methyl ester carboxylesterase